MKNVAQLLLMCDGHDIGLSVDGGSLDRSTRTGGIGGVPEALATEPNVFIYDNYPGRHRLQPAALRHARPAARAHARPDRGLPLRVGLPVVRRARREHRPARQAGRVAHPRSSCSTAQAEAAGLLMDLTSRLRARSSRSGPPKPVRELTYEPDTGGYEAVDGHRRRSARSSAAVPSTRSFGQCLVIDRRYESDRFHGDVRIGDCEVLEGDGRCESWIRRSRSPGTTARPARGSDPERRVSPGGAADARPHRSSSTSRPPA